jgi:hypothetical protein
VAQSVGRVIVLLFHDSGTRRGWAVSSTSRPHFTPGKDPVPILLEAGLPPEKTRYTFYRRLGYPQERLGTHFTGGWVTPGKDSVTILQEAGLAPGKTRYPFYRSLVYPRKRPDTHFTGVCVTLGKDSVTILQKVGLTPGKTLYPFYRRLGYPRKRPGTHFTGGWVTPGKDPVPILQEAGWTQWTVWTGGKSCPSRDFFRSRTIQSVVSRYTDWATRPTVIMVEGNNIGCAYRQLQRGA